MESPKTSAAQLELIAPDNSSRQVPITSSPFFIGRGEDDNQMALADMRISRQCAAIIQERGSYFLTDRGHRRGVFINGRPISRQELFDGDLISFGLEDSFKVRFHGAERNDQAIQHILTKMGTSTEADGAASGLGKLNLLLEATRLLHSQLPLDAVLDAMLDRAIAITSAERGLLMEADDSGELRPILARTSGAGAIPPDSIAPSQTALKMAIQQQYGVITEDLQNAEGALVAAQSIVGQQLRAVIAIPLYSMPRANSFKSIVGIQRGQFLGLLYLDSRRATAFSKLDREILDAITIECASILDNARLVKREQEQKRLEQELDIARNIQQALLPKGFQDFPFLKLGGMNLPCHAVGGDYFDAFRIADSHVAFLIADVSGKGLGAALLTTMLQGALTGMAHGAEPGTVIRHINDFLCSHEQVGRYSTLFYATVDSGGRLDYINAGHLPPLLIREGEISELFHSGSLPVGLVPEAEFNVSTFQLQPADTLVLFSDGVTEAANVNEEMFGVERLQHCLAGQGEQSLDPICKRIFDSVQTFSLGAPQADDITVLLVRYLPPQ